MSGTIQASEILVGPHEIREAYYDEPWHTIMERHERVRRMNRQAAIASARVRGRRLGWIAVAFLMIAFIAALVLLFAASGQAAPRPETKPSAMTVVVRRPRAFNRKMFLAESIAFTASNVFDGITTVHDSRIGFYEASFPRGNAELLGQFPGAGRYAAVMVTEQALVELAAYRLERSQREPLRVTGHALMTGSALLHFGGAIANVRSWSRYGR
jgi:hypothetical protein